MNLHGTTPDRGVTEAVLDGEVGDADGEVVQEEPRGESLTVHHDLSCGVGPTLYDGVGVGYGEVDVVEPCVEPRHHVDYASHPGEGEVA